MKLIKLVKRRIRTARLSSIALLSCLLLSGQMTQRSLQRTYRQDSDGAFLIKPGIRVTVAYGAHQQVCALLISGPTSRQELFETFDQVVPLKLRGLERIHPFVCVNVCMESIDYENLKFETVSQGGRPSEPAAKVIFHRPDCQMATREVHKVPLRIPYK